MGNYGIFISYRRPDWALAGRVYDFLEGKGLHPFWDAACLNHGKFPDILRKEIESAPYFLCVLTSNTFADRGTDNWVCTEIAIALSCPDKEILFVAEDGYTWPEDLPRELAKVREIHIRHFNRASFRDEMERLYERSIDWSRLVGKVDWPSRIQCGSNVCLVDRERLEKGLTSLEDRFGREMVTALQEGREYEGENRVRFIHMSCYAASSVLTPQQNMMDERAYDLKILFKIFQWMLRDSGFSLEIIINAPGSYAMKDAIEREKLGNSSAEKCPEAIFLGSYSHIWRLISEDPVFSEAYEKKRFRFMVTENVLPYALFQVEYKQDYAQYNHIKVDLYSEGITSNMDRRSMMIFRQKDSENYKFFVQRYEYTRNIKASQRLIKKNHEKWLAQWEVVKEYV